MLIFRVRRFGQSEWTTISINGPAKAFLNQLVGGALTSADLHVQQLDEESEWTNLAELGCYDGVDIDDEEEDC